MTNTVKYPTQAADIPASPYEGRDDFFFAFNLFRREQDDNGTIHLVLDGTTPLLVNNEKMRNEIAEKTGVILPTRKEFSNHSISDDVRHYWPRINWDQMYTGAVGAFVHVIDSQDQDRLYLLQNSASKDKNPNKWNTASGLISSCRPDETAFLETTEELGLLSVYGDHLVGRVLTMGDSLPGLSAEFRGQVCRDKYQIKRDQEANIRARLTVTHPEHAQKPIEWMGFVSQAVNSDVCEGVVVSMMEQEFKLRAHVVADDDAKSVNMHFPVLAARGFDCIAVDPEKFGRNAGLFTLDEAANLDTIPAPRDYIERLLATHKPAFGL